MIVDRKVVLINSCNIQDRPNLEMMTHLEGPVIDSFYDIALHCWYNKLEPPLPCISQCYEPPRDANGNIQYLFRDYNPYFRDIEVLKAARAARKLLRRQTQQIDDERLAENAHPTRDRLVGAMRNAMAGPRQSFAHNKEELAKTFAQNKEELSHRGSIAMNNLRDNVAQFGERMGMNFEKFGSRPGSRRTSMSESRHAPGGRDHDDETAAITAANQILTKPAPSEAQTSPTLHEFPAPVKANTYPAPYHPHFDDEDQTTTVSSSRRQSFYSAHDELSRRDSHGPPVSTDVHTGFTGRPIVDSPVDDMRERNGEREMVTLSSMPPTASPAVTTRSLEGSGISPTSPFGDDASAHPGTESTVNDSAAPRPSWADDIPSGAQTPHYAPKVSMDEEIPPGRGTKRMFKLSKRFSELHCVNILLTARCRCPQRSLGHGRGF